MAQGVVVRFDETKGYGFISPNEGGEDVFVHANDVSDADKPLLCGARVQFGLLDGERGLKAYNVRVTELAADVGASASSAPAPTAASEPLSGEAAASTARAQLSGRDAESVGYETCEVLSEREFTGLATETLLASSPDLTAKQIVQIREALAAFASERGWVD